VVAALKYLLVFATGAMVTLRISLCGYLIEERSVESGAASGYRTTLKHGWRVSRWPLRSLRHVITVWVMNLIRPHYRHDQRHLSALPARGGSTRSIVVLSARKSVWLDVMFCRVADRWWHPASRTGCTAAILCRPEADHPSPSAKGSRNPACTSEVSHALQA